jgi:pimeloyl-ACP methyl ester carboxylesterase
MTTPNGLTLDSLQTRNAAGVRVRFADSGGDRPLTVLMTSPWPESLLAFRRIWTRLEPLARLVAIDLPGFGQSELRRDLLSPPAMSEFLNTLIGEWDLGAPHLVAPDVGSSAALFLAAQHPESISSVITGSGAACYPLQVAGALSDLIFMPDIEPLRAQDATATVGASVEIAAPRAEEPDIWQDYVTSYGNDRFAESTRYVRSYPTSLELLGTMLADITAPTLIINSAVDPLVPAVNGDYLHERIANSTLVNVDTVHFAWELKPEEYGGFIAEWISGGYRDLG